MMEYEHGKHSQAQNTCSCMCYTHIYEHISTYIPDTSSLCSEVTSDDAIGTCGYKDFNWDQQEARQLP